MKTASVEVKVNGVWRGASVASAEQAIEFGMLFNAMGFESAVALHPAVCIPTRAVTFQSVCEQLFTGNWPVQYASLYTADAA